MKPTLKIKDSHISHHTAQTHCPSRRIGLPHIDHHALRSIPRQHTHSHNIIEPVVSPIRRRLEFASQQRSSIGLSRAFCLHIDPGAVICLNIVACIGADLPVLVCETPVCAEIDDFAYEISAQGSNADSSSSC